MCGIFCNFVVDLLLNMIYPENIEKKIGFDAVRRMVERGEDCSEVLVQLSAVISALNSTGRVILKDHIAHCIVDAVEEGNTAAIDSLNDAIDRFMR